MDVSLGDFLGRHAIAFESAEVLSAPHLGALAAALYGRNREGAEVGQRAGALLLELMFDFFAVWSPRRSMPLMRKDLHAGGDWVSALVTGEDGLFEFARERRVPVVRQAFAL